MKSIKYILFVLIIFSAAQSNAQENYMKGWTGETSFSLSFYRLGSYVKERPTFFLEQAFLNRINKRLSLGAGICINAYPALLGMPIYASGVYHLNIKSYHLSFNQTFGRNVKLGDVFFDSWRCLGYCELGISLKNVLLKPKLGYNLLWDKYGGRNLSFIIGIGLKYNLTKNNHNKT